MQWSLGRSARWRDPQHEASQRAVCATPRRQKRRGLLGGRRSERGACDWLTSLSSRGTLRRVPLVWRALKGLGSLVTPGCILFWLAYVGCSFVGCVKQVGCKWLEMCDVSYL